MFYRPRLGMVLVSACLTIHAFSSGMSYFLNLYFYIVCCYFLLLKNKFDLKIVSASRMDEAKGKFFLIGQCTCSAVSA